MNKRKIYITVSDYKKLKQLYTQPVELKNNDIRTLRQLLEELERATIVNAEDLSDRVVTMNSTVLFEDLDTGIKYTYTIVYPEQADSAKNKISIFAPIGAALLGYSVGDTIEWAVPKGKRRLKVIAVLNQPEALAKKELHRYLIHSQYA